MPPTAEQERRLLNRYKLTSLTPDTWPHADDDDDASASSDDDDNASPQANGGPVRQPPPLSKRTSRFRTIDRHASTRSANSLGPDSVVHKDESDPLGMAPSVALELKRRGLPVEEDLKLRNRFMLTSSTFDPQAFLAHVHRDASTDDLLRGLDFLSNSIEQKSASLKVLVESNFEKFVKAKSTIDNVYTEMRTQGADETLPTSPALAGGPGARKPHSRHASKTQSQFRNSSAPFSPSFGSPGAAARAESKKKNALTKESEYGVLGIKAPLQELAIRAEEVWGPALGGREREETFKAVLSTLDQHREVFRLSGDVHEAIKKNDYDTVVESWRKATKYADTARTIADVAKSQGSPISDEDARLVLLIAKMFHDVSEQIETYKHSLWQRLKNSHGRKVAAVADETDKEEHLELIAVLLQLGVDESPIWVWLSSRSLYLKDRIARTFERSRIEIEILRRRLATNDGQDGKQLAQYLRSASYDSKALLTQRNGVKELDMPAIVAFWEKVHASLRQLLSSSTGVLGEVLEFWGITQSFIDNKAQKSFPATVFSSPGAVEHLELDPDYVQNLRSGAVDLANQIRENIMSFFADAPVEDLSELYSPIPPTPITPDSARNKTPVSGAPAGIHRAFSFDPNNVPPPSPKKGKSWEKFAFWAPYANSLSSSHYLSKVLTLVGTAAAELAGLSVVKQARGVEALKLLVGSVRERCIQALSAAWVQDSERSKWLETWQRSTDRRDLTNFPAVFMAFEEKVLTNFQRVAYLSEAAAANGRGGAEVIVPPPAKLLQAIRGSFVTSLYKTLSGMVENAEKTRPVTGAGSFGDVDGVLRVPGKVAVGADGVDGVVDASNRNIRILLTLSNLAYLRTDCIPHLVSQFETAFTVKLTDESKTIRDVLSQIDARLFQSHVKPTVEKLAILIHDGINHVDWAPKEGRPDNAKPYVYDVLLSLVLVHSEVSTTAATLTNQILSYLLEQSSVNLLESFKKAHTHYSLPALMQATLDVEFLAQTLNTFTTDRAGEVQSQIYLALDEKTDDASRHKLQGELPEMRTVLKRLREGTKGEFGCFKRERRGREGRSGGGSTGGGGGGGGGDGKG